MNLIESYIYVYMRLARTSHRFSNLKKTVFAKAVLSPPPRNRQKTVDTGGKKDKKPGSEIIVLKKLSFHKRLFFPLRANFA